MMSRAALYALLGLAATAGLGRAAPAEIPLKLPSGRALTVELMVRAEDQARGLMYRETLAQDRALLFVFERAEYHGIWMKNCRFPIDIVWLDAERRVVYLASAVPPCKQDPCPVYQPPRRALYVLELNAGRARSEQLEPGSRLDFTLPPP